jgi:ZIP family zinc transporter
MSQIFIVIISSWLAGAAAIAGGVFGALEPSSESDAKSEFIHGVVAFGGGILVAAVAFALVPEGIEYLSSLMLGGLFVLGGAAFCALDVYLSRTGGTKAQFMAMLMDFIPEAISLGAVFAHAHKFGIMLALFIGLQNLPEGFNSYRELKSSGNKTGSILFSFFAVSFLGPLAALVGFLFLQDYHQLTAGIMVFAGGGILYLVFQDIAPLSKMKHRWLPSLGAVLGFVIGMMGKKLLG